MSAVLSRLGIHCISDLLSAATIVACVAFIGWLLLVLTGCNVTSESCDHLRFRVTCGIISKVQFRERRRETPWVWQADLLRVIQSVPGTWNIHQDEYAASFLVADSFNESQVCEAVRSAILANCPNSREGWE